MESELLIAAVRKRTPLWNKNNKYYKNRDVNNRLWKEISKEIGVNADVLRRKWKGLKDMFRKELKKQVTIGFKSGLHTSRWVFYDSLMFLSSHMKTRDGSGHLSSIDQQIEPDETEVAGLSLPAGVQNIPELNLPNPSTTEDGDGQHEGDSSPASSDEQCTSKDRSRKAKRFRHDDASKLVDLEKKLSILKGCCNQGKSDDYHFLMSFLPHVENLPLEKKMMFRVKMQELLYTTLFLSDSAEKNDD
ncbi:uncharacterized protein LOC124162205 [Ischnura elegans]|uniref:uncharacterized protein LOC124162205 n=1 Tax=Ischnura elegans TaxID=197161 RepID=UPI001ED86A35|nr:uncharacterized protein LOC124162205 [Ischnura elegans]